MRRIIIITGLLTLFIVQSSAQFDKAPEPAESVLKQALQEAAASHKNVLLIFHASWCGWCHRMDTSLSDPVCRKMFEDNYVITHLVVHESEGKKNLENPGAEAMKANYNGEGQGIPFWLIFDPIGNLLADSKIRTEGQGPGAGENTGCPATEKEVSYFIETVKKTSALDEQQLEIIRKRFRENDH